jgi:NAD-dependent dihydropyrimidine dehydrogenase PreA subunit
MKRTIIKIDEEKCTGCGLCVSGCHEGALQLIEGKARMISELFCDRLGACIGDCPEGAIILEEREAEPYDEIAVMELISVKGETTVLAHLKHLKDHNESVYLAQGIQYIKDANLKIDISSLESKPVNTMEHQHHQGCPGSKSMDFRDQYNESSTGDTSSQLRQWPVQLHLLSPMAGYFQKADVLLAADCVAFAMGNFHNAYLKDKILAIACPKLDTNKEVYIEKITAMIDEAKINTLTVMMMEVPCCGGLIQMAKTAAEKASRKIPIKAIYISIQGEVLSEDWV